MLLVGSCCPLAIPLLAGPGSLATVTMLMSRSASVATTAVLLLAIGLVFIATYVVLRSANWLQGFLGPAILAVVQRVLGGLQSRIGAI